MSKHSHRNMPGVERPRFQRDVSLPDKQRMEEAKLLTCPECGRAAGRHGPRCSLRDGSR